MKIARVWEAFWAWAGRVPIRQKIIGIVVASLLILGFAIAWWVRSGLGGWLSYLLSEERVAQAMAAGTRGVFIITILAALVGLVVAWLLTWVLTRPVLHITRVARGVEKGDLTLRAPVWAKDEIGELGQAFNAMIESLARSRRDLETFNEQLHQRYRELAVLYEIAGMASQSLNAERILNDGLEKILEIAEAEAGAVTLLDEVDDRLTLRAQRNMPPALLNSSALYCQGEGLICQVIQSGQPLFIENIGNQPHIPAALAGVSQEFGYRAFAGVPIRSKGKVLGALNILSQARKRFEPEDVSLLIAVGNQLGVAVENARLWEELKQKEAIRARLLAKVESAQEEERRRISRELHDETGQALTTLLVQLKMLERSPDLEAIHQRTAGLRELTAQTLEEVRRLALDLRPSALDDLGLVPALEWYIAEFARNAKIHVYFETHDLDDIRLPHEMEIVLYRIVQETLTNVARHSRAEHAWVQLEREDSTVRVSIEDDGQGFDVEETLQSQEHSLGLLGMRERVELIGGSFHLESARGSGTHLCIEAPLPPGSEREGNEEAHSGVAG